MDIKGGCNVQFALHPENLEYVVIEVNPRLSRSSALASKATGYPIARSAAKIAVGYTLPELRSAVIGQTSACFEPALDYVVVKISRWPFDKFSDAERTIGTQMKSTGEVMGLGRNLETALLKAVRSLETKFFGLLDPALEALSDGEIEGKCQRPEDDHLFIIGEAFRRGWTVEQIAGQNQWNHYFLQKIKGIVDLAEKLRANPFSIATLKQAKKIGYADFGIARLWQTTEEEVYKYRINNGLRPIFKMVDTYVGEFEVTALYFYSSYDDDNEDEGECSSRRKVVVLGSGPIRIGQGIEFDYCSVHAVKALRQPGVESIIINNNPKTVSTDFDTADRLYFEPLTLEDICAVLEKEKPEGVIVQFGGQTAIGLSKGLEAREYKILGTSVKDTDQAEDRGLFDEVLQALGARRPEGGYVFAVEEAETLAAQIGFPLIVRPSYVLGGRAMQIVYDRLQLRVVLNKAFQEFFGQPIWIDQYLIGQEVEMPYPMGKRCVFPAG